MILKKITLCEMCILLFMCCSQTEGRITTKFRKFMQSHLDSANNQLTTLLDQGSYMKDMKAEIRLNKVTLISVQGNPHTAALFSMFNQTYAQFDLKVRRVLIKEELLGFMDVVAFTNTEEITFFKTIVHGNVGVAFLGHATGPSEIFGYSKVGNKWFAVQSIASVDRAADATFFKNQNNLYLVIANTRGHASTHASIYKWTNSHFDEIDTILTTDAFRVLSFTNKKSEIIIIYETSEEEKEGNLMVLEFNNERTKKIQLLSTRGAKHLALYRAHGQAFLAVFEEIGNSTLYLWEGSEFVTWRKFDNFQNVKKVGVVTYKKIPLIVLIEEFDEAGVYENRLWVFSHSASTLEFNTKIRLDEVYKTFFDSMKIINYMNEFCITMLALSNYDAMKFVFVPVTMNLYEIDVKPQGNDILLQCLIKLEKRVVSNQHKLELLSEPSKKIIQTNEPLEFKGRVNAASSIFADSANINSQSITSEFQHQANELKDQLDSLTNQINLLTPKLKTLFHKGDSEISGNLVILGELYGEQLATKNLHVKYLNGVRWNPDMWLSYSKPQTITGRVIAKQVHAKNLTIADGNMYNGHNISDFRILNSLKVNKIYANKINDVPLKDIYLRSKPVTIRGIKTFSNLSADEMQVNLLNEKPPSEAFTQSLSSTKWKFGPNLKIKTFNFEEINGIRWDVFRKSVFQINITNEIAGNIAGPTITADRLYAKTISKIDTNTLLTTSTDQIINSKIQFQNVVAQNVICETVNDINLKTDAVSPINNVVKGPVSVDNISIRGNLHINTPTPGTDEVDVSGTKESDLLQIYNKRVRIIGNLYLSNLQVPKTAKIFVNNKFFKENLTTTYWLKNKNQIIPTHFEAQGGISAPHLSCVLLNNVLVSSYLINNLDDKLPSNLLFENATIMGNVIINETLQHSPDLKKMDLESVKLSGSYNIVGRKTIQGKVSVGNLVTNYLDEITMENVLTTKNSDAITGKKTFENLVVTGNIDANNITTVLLNNVNLQTVQDWALFIDQPEQMDTLAFDNVEAQKMFATYVNKVKFNEYVEYMDDVYAMTTLNNLVINGNVRVKNVQNLSSINDYSTHDLFDNLVKHEGADLVLKNDVRFYGTVYAENLNVVYLNDINFPEFIEKMLYKNWDQTITARYRFDQINTPNLITPQINDIPTKHLISTTDTAEQNLVVFGGIQFFSPLFRGSVYGNLQICNLVDAAANLRSPPAGLWNTVHISQNITLWDEFCELSTILKKAVHSKRNNIIDAPVVFEHHFSSNTVYIQKHINGIDINEIFNDALLTNKVNQLVVGRKWFGNIATTYAYVDGNVDIPIINNIDIANLNRSIISKNNIHDTVIRGSKVFFSGFQGDRLISNNIENLNPENLVSLDDLKPIPSAHFHSLEVENDFNIGMLHDLNVSDILLKRVKRYGDEDQVLLGTYFFDEIYIVDKSDIPKINDVEINDVVYDTGNQTVFGQKTFTKETLINANIDVKILNGHEVFETYLEAVLNHEPSIIPGSIEVQNDTNVVCDIETDHINGVSVEYLKKLMLSKTTFIETERVSKTVEEMDDIITIAMKMTRSLSNKYLHLERASDVQISVQNVVSARTLQVDSDVLLSIQRLKWGAACGFDTDFCSCHTQETIRISENLSINTIANVGIQRHFSYDKKGISIRLYTTSVSTSPDCQVVGPWGISNETTSVIWMMSSPKFFTKIEDDFVKGYISGVEYFEHGGYIYMVVGRFFDPTISSHLINCVVYKFLNEDKRVKEIQRIKSNRASILYLFHTAQGITLIIGNTFDLKTTTRNAGANIYRFDEQTEQFMMLRKVSSTGCTAAAAVVLDSDSLIVLAQERMPLQVFKYHPKYDNYYFYQSIFLDSPVRGISVFYIGGFGISDAYLCVVTEDSNFYIYSYQYVQGLQVISSGIIEGLQTLVPFKLKREHYLFAGSTKDSLLLTVTKQGYN